MHENRPARVVKAGPQTFIELTEQELILLETQSNESIYKDFAIFLLSIGMSGLIACCTITPETIASHFLSLLYSITFCSLVIGVICGILWRIKSKNKNDILRRIRQRFEVDQKM